MVDVRYRNKKNGRTAVVVQEDAKYKTVLIQYEDDESEQQVSFSTLKRWWEELDDDNEELDDEVVDDADDEEEYDDDDEEYDDEDVEEDEDVEDEEEEEADEDAEEEDEVEEAPKSKKKEATPAKKEVKKEAPAPKAKKELKRVEANPEVGALLDYVAKVTEKFKGDVVKGKHGLASGSLKIDGHRFAKFSSSKQMMRLNLRPDATKAIAKPVRVTAQMFGAEYHFTALDKDTKALIDKLMKASVDAQKVYAKEKAEAKANKKGGKKNA